MQLLLCAAGVVRPSLGACGQAGQVVYCQGAFASVWRFPEKEAALGNHSAQSRASVRGASPGHAMGHCEVEGSIFSLQQVWWRLHWVLRQGWEGGFRGLWFSHLLEFSS